MAAAIIEINGRDVHIHKVIPFSKDFRRAGAEFGAERGKVSESAPLEYSW